MKEVPAGLTYAKILYHEFSCHPFELITQQHFISNIGLQGANLRMPVSETRRLLKPGEAIFGVHGEGYVFTNTPASYGDVVQVKDIRPFPWSWLDKYPVHADEIVSLVDMIQKGIITESVTMNPVFSKEPYSLLLGFVRAYMEDKPLSVSDIALYRNSKYAYNMVKRVREGLNISTGGRWGIPKPSASGEYFLKHVPDTTTCL